MKKSDKPVINVPTMLVLAAACTANRFNKGYRKHSLDEQKSNRDLVNEFIKDPSEIKQEDHDLAENIRDWYQAKVFKILSESYLSSFDKLAMSLFQKETLDSNYDIAIASSLPSSYLNGVKHDENERRVKFADGGYLGRVGERITINIEVMKCIFSVKWHVHFITAITEKDQVLFFSFKRELNSGDKLKIKGTVKSQDNNQTRLNRVTEV